MTRQICITQTRQYLTSSVRQAVPPYEGQEEEEQQQQEQEEGEGGRGEEGLLAPDLPSHRYSQRVSNSIHSSYKTRMPYVTSCHHLPVSGLGDLRGAGSSGLGDLRGAGRREEGGRREGYGRPQERTEPFEFDAICMCLGDLHMCCMYSDDLHVFLHIFM